MTIDIRQNYFEWLYDVVASQGVSYRKLIEYLHQVPFKWDNPYDQNRAEDGISLRWRYTCFNYLGSVPPCLDAPCSMLEMMVALAIRCEETIKDDPVMGDRTKQWFWEMVVSLGLGGMNDIRFDPHVVDDVLERFFNRDYEPNGRGGLFMVRDSVIDMRTVEIWYQLRYYLNTCT